jgi:hypothetical protein
MSDASGPFAVPNFSQPSGASEDADESEYDDDDFEGDEDESEAEPDLRTETFVVAEPEEAPVTSADGGSAQAVLEHIARSIVDEPQAVVVDASSQRGGLRLDLHVAPSDMGRIIGRRGRVAQALRSVVRAAAAKDGTDATVDIVD